MAVSDRHQASLLSLPLSSLPYKYEDAPADTSESRHWQHPSIRCTVPGTRESETINLFGAIRFRFRLLNYYFFWRAIAFDFAFLTINLLVRGFAFFSAVAVTCLFAALLYQNYECT